MSEKTKEFDATVEAALDLPPSQPVQIDQLPDIIPTEKEIVPVANNATGDVESDYNTGREALQDLITTARDTIDVLQEEAQNDPSPRHFEVLFEGLKKTSEIVEKLMNHHTNYVQAKQETTARDGPGEGDVVNNTLVLTTEQLQDFLAKKDMKNVN